MAESAETLHEQLARWTAGGLIEAGQAGRIEAAETARMVTATPRRLPLIAEVLGYVGAVVAVAAAIIAVPQVFRPVPPVAELAIAAVAGAGLLVAGAAVPAAREPALARLRSVLWLLATIAVAAFAGVLARHFLHLADKNALLAAEVAWLAGAGPLWWRTRSAAQHLAAFAGVVALAETGLDRIDPQAGSFGFGLTLWLVAAVWAAATWRGYLRPELAGLLLAGTGLLTGAMIAMDAAAGQALAAATVTGLFVTGVLSRRVLPIVFGAIGTIWIVPEVAHRYLPGSAWAPLSVAVTGLVLCGAAIWLARSRHTAQG
ncbi:MAG: hypothetical protein ACR2FU_16105 [Streptosporangiaceae bacterium]